MSMHMQHIHLVEGLELDLFWWQCLIGKGPFNCVQVMVPMATRLRFLHELTQSRIHNVYVCSLLLNQWLNLPSNGLV